MNGVSFANVAGAQLRACQVTGSFIERQISPIVRGAVDRTNPLQDTVAAYLDRVGSWLRTLGKLDQLSDFQAVDAAARSLFEIVVDLTLLQRDGDCPPQKMLDWELCARFRRSEHRLSVLAKLNDPHSQGLAMIARTFIATNAQAVTDARTTWGWKRDPLRWTGRNLFEDAKRCDEVSSSHHASHYALRHTDLCWNTHGSGFAGLRGLDEQAIAAGVAQSFNDVHVLARAAVELVLDLLHRLDDSTSKQLEALDGEISAAQRAVLLSVLRGRVRTSSARTPRSVATRALGAVWIPAGVRYREWKTAEARHCKVRRTSDLVLVLRVGDSRVQVDRGRDLVWVDPSEFRDVSLPVAAD